MPARKIPAMLILTWPTWLIRLEGLRIYQSSQKVFKVMDAGSSLATTGASALYDVRPWTGTAIHCDMMTLPTAKFNVSPLD
jgi:hypothetical protein